MHVMFIHPNFPAQFGHVAFYLTTQLGWTCTFVTSIDTTELQLPFNHLNYRVNEGPQPKTFFNPENVQGLMDHLLAVYRGLRGVPQLQPDLVVGHMSYGTLLYLRNIYQCPFIGYFEMLPPPFWTEEAVLRQEFPPPEGVRLFNATYHTMTYLHLHAIDAGYTPTNFQLSTAPVELQHKLRVVPDGVDCDFFQRKPVERPTEFHGVRIGPETKVVTYVSPGLESVRGFDIFMKAAKIMAEQNPNAVFLIAGDERTQYGHEQHYLKEQSFKQWVLAQDNYDLSRFHFLGIIPPQDLVTLFNLSDVHMYLTVPHIVSHSLLQAMASECVVVGSATPPVQEFVEDGANGLLADFYDAQGLAERALAVLADPAQHRPLATAARARVVDTNEAKKCLQQLAAFFQEYQVNTSDDVFTSLAGPPE